MLFTQSFSIYAKQPADSSVTESSVDELPSEGENTVVQEDDNSSLPKLDSDGLWFIEGKYTAASAGDMAKKMALIFGEGASISTSEHTLWYHRDAKKVSADDEGDVYETNRIVVRENSDLTGTLTMVSEEITMPHMTEEEHEKWGNPIEGLEWGMTTEEISDIYDLTEDANGTLSLNESYELYGQPMQITLTVDSFVGLEKVTGKYDISKEGETGKKLEAIYSTLDNEGSGMWSYSYGTVSDIRTDEQVKQMYREIYADPDTVSDIVVAGAMANSLETVRLKEIDGYGLFEMNASMLLFFGAVE